MSSGIHEISASELAALIDAPDSRGPVFLIDVREVDEYVGGHVPGALNVPLSELTQRVVECRNPSGGPTYVICKSGGRSANACEFLAGNSLEVVNIAGGTMVWQMNGRDVVPGGNPL